MLGCSKVWQIESKLLPRTVYLKTKLWWEGLCKTQMLRDLPFDQSMKGISICIISLILWKMMLDQHTFTVAQSPTNELKQLKFYFNCFLLENNDLCTWNNFWEK